MEHSIERANQTIREHSGTVNQQYRTGFHAMPPVGWINDPNGLCFFQGQYHLFCQYHPYEAKWGPMHWGHWTSPDLLNWKWQGVAMAPDTPADCNGVFSGHAIVEGDSMIVMYTGVSFTKEGEERQQQCIARSKDGIHFEKDAHNPVISTAQLPEGSDPRNFRDPKLFKVKNEYRAVMASRNESGGRLLVYCSEDLVHWTFGGVFASGVGEMLECPDYHEIDGKDVLTACVMNMPQDGFRFPHTNPVIYLLGETNEEKTSFAIQTFEALDNGPNFYAPQAVDSPEGCIMMGWMPGWGGRFPTEYLGHHWCGMISFPRVLHVRNGKIYQEPVPALSQLREKPENISAQLAPFEKLEGFHGKRAEFLLQCNTDAVLKLHLFAGEDEGFLVEYDPSRHLLTMNRNHCGHPTAQEQGIPETVSTILSAESHELRLHIILDTCAIELFANDGERTMSACLYPYGDSQWKWNIVSEGNCEVLGTIYPLKYTNQNIWGCANYDLP